MIYLFWTVDDILKGLLLCLITNYCLIFLWKAQMTVKIEPPPLISIRYMTLISNLWPQYRLFLVSFTHVSLLTLYELNLQLKDLSRHKMLVAVAVWVTLKFSYGIWAKNPEQLFLSNGTAENKLSILEWKTTNTMHNQIKSDLSWIAN